MWHLGGNRTKVGNATRQPEREITIVGIERYRDGHGLSRLMESAVVFYVAGAQSGKFEVAMTWESLALLRRAATKAGLSFSDEELITRVMGEYAREELDLSYRNGRLPQAPVLLDLSTLGPASTYGYELLIRSLNATPIASGSPSVA